MSMRIASTVLSAALFAPLGCAPEPEPEPTPSSDAGVVVSEIAPVNPTGSVAGIVIDASTGAGLAGIDVSVQVPAEEGANTTTTGEDGSFLLEGLPASANLNVRYSDAAGAYYDAWDTVVIPSAAGNLAQDNGVAFSGPVALLPTAAGFAAQVRVREDGAAPAAAPTVTASLAARFLVDGAARGTVLGTGTDAGGGDFSIDGLPDLALLAAVAPATNLTVVVVPGDAALSPVVRTESVRAIVDRGAIFVDLDPIDAQPDAPDEEFRITASNVADLVEDQVVFPSVLSPGDAVTLTFSRDVDANTFFAAALDGQGDPLGVTTMISGADVTLTIASVAAGSEVFVQLEAFPAGLEPDGDGQLPVVRQSGFFLTPSADGKARAAGHDPNTGNNRMFLNQDLNQLGCPDETGTVRLQLTMPVGGRTVDGDPISLDRFLPFRVTSNDPKLQVGHPLLPASDGVVTGRLIDPPTGVPASGYTKWVELDWNATDPWADAATTATFQLNVQFNDAANAAGNQDAVVRMPDGSPAVFGDAGAQGAVAWTIRGNCNL
jgi:hypothetical protein